MLTPFLIINYPLIIVFHLSLRSKRNRSKRNRKIFIFRLLFFTFRFAHSSAQLFASLIPLLSEWLLAINGTVQNKINHFAHIRRLSHRLICLAECLTISPMASAFVRSFNIHFYTTVPSFLPLLGGTLLAINATAQNKIEKYSFYDYCFSTLTSFVALLGAKKKPF